LLARATNVDSGSDLQRKSIGDGNAHTDGDGNAHTDGDGNAHTDGDGNAHTDGDGNAHTDGDGNADGRAYGYKSDRHRRRSYANRRRNYRYHSSGTHDRLLLHHEENIVVQSAFDRYVEVNKSDVYNRILELDLRKMEKRHERHIWHIKSMWGGLAGILLAVYALITTQYLFGNPLLTRNDNYIFSGGALLLSIALCYGLMWIGVVSEYKKFERVINDRISYYENIIDASQRT
jgi:hypothetical protein